MPAFLAISDDFYFIILVFFFSNEKKCSLCFRFGVGNRTANYKKNLIASGAPYLFYLTRTFPSYNAEFGFCLVGILKINYFFSLYVEYVQV